MKLKNPKDFWSGVMFALVGFAFAAIAQTYPVGNASKMGPGYFPLVLGLLLGLIGLFIATKSLATSGDKINKFAWKPLVWILVAVVIFGLTSKLLGIALSIVVLVFLSAYGGHEFKLEEVAIAAVVLALGSVLVFIYGLKLPFPIWPSFLQ